MSNFITFHKSVMGYLHEQKQKPCQDCSGDYNGEEEGNPYYIAVIADGHGSSACPRSEIGSQEIVEIVLEDFKEFARTMLEEKGQTDSFFGIYEQFAILKYQRQMMKNLTDSIISKWKKAVRNHLNSNSLSEEEIEKSGEFYAEQYRRGEHLEHLYGTTVIAALKLPDYLVLIQQGDGRCDVFYEDNTVDQPIPWDPRCHENITTSMCDVDVLQSIRSKVILLKEKSVIACYMGSDGVEDSYIDSSLDKDDKHYMEGTHMFYRDITCRLLDCYEKLPSKEGCKTALEEALRKWLPDFSKTGSGDDVSVSGIVDLEKVKKFKKDFETSVERYYLQDELRQWEERLGSMERKYRILEERSENIRKQENQLKKEENKLNNEIEHLKNEIDDQKDLNAINSKDKEEFKEKIKKINSDWEESQREGDIEKFAKKYLPPTCKNITKGAKAFLGNHNQTMESYKEKEENNEKTLRKLNEKLKIKEKAKQEIQKQLKQLVENSSHQEFRKYKETYEKVQSKIEEIKQKIGSL
ncbi:MAG: protein phosphatase 2C domain-containing protein [Lachnospiraceae bacterium]